MHVYTYKYKCKMQKESVVSRVLLLYRKGFFFYQGFVVIDGGGNAMRLKTNKISQRSNRNGRFLPPSSRHPLHACVRIILFFYIL